MNLRATTQVTREIAINRLDRYIQEGQQRALAVQEKVVRDVPTDYIAPAGTIRFANTNRDSGLEMVLDRKDGRTVANPLHRHGLGQAAELAKMPMAYVDHLLGQGGWGQELLARNLTDGVQYGHQGSRYLVRSCGGQVRAVLSSKFRRLDSRPILDMLIGESQRVGAIPVDAIASDIRTEVKFIIPKVLEPAPGEFMVFGFAWGTSDYGAGANWVRSFAFRLACFNGATMEQALRQVHVGRALTDDVEWSQRTLELDTKTAISGTRDVARALLSEAKISQTASLITKANAEGIDAKVTLAGMRKKIGAGTEKAIAEAFNSADVVELPPR